MRKLVKTALAALAATVFTAPAWAAIDVTGLNPWACYEFNGGDIRNTGSGERGWNGGGSSSPAPGATGAANTAVSINKWTNTGDVSTVGGLTVSLLATEGTAHSTADRNGHIFSLAAKGASGEPQWWLRNTGTTGQVKLQGVFTEDLTITLPEGSTDATFHHYVIAISGDRTQAAVYVDGVPVETAGMTVKETENGTGVNDAFFGYQVGARWGGGEASRCVVDDLRIYTAMLTPVQVAALYGGFYANDTAYVRTIAGTTADWKATEAWQSGESSADVPAVGSQATLTANADTTVTLNDVAALSQLTIEGAGAVKLVGAQKGGLSATTATINTTVDLSEVSACLGAVTIAAGKTLTVQGGSSVLSDLTFGDATACLKVYGEETATPATALALDGAMTKTGTLIFDCPLTLDSALAFGSGGTTPSVTQNVTLRKNIAATRLITGNGDKNVTNIVQEGGDITLSQVDDGTPMASLGDRDTKPYAILFGHWPSTSNYQLKAGSLTAEHGYAHLGWDGGNVTVTVGQSLEEAQGTTALLKVKGFTGNKRENAATLTVNPSGTLAIGSAGFTMGKTAKHVKLAGGTLLAYETLTTELTANGLEITEPSTVAAATGATLTLDKLAGNETTTLTIGTAENAGTVVLSALTGFTGTVTVAAGTAVLTTLPTANDVTVKAGAKLKCHVSFEQAEAGVKATHVNLKDNATMVFVLPSGLEIAGSGEGGNELASQAYYTWAPTVDSNWSTLGNWKKSGVAISELPGEDARVRIRATEATTLTMDVADAVNELTIEGGGTVTLAGEQTLTVKDTLFVVTDVASSATVVAAPKVSLVQGYTLSLTGGNLPAATTYSGDGTLAITGSVTYATGATIEAPFVVATGGTLDLAGQTLTSPVTLQGGTLANASETRAYARKVTLAADSKIVCDGGALTLSSGTNARDELTLGGHTLTKTGNAEFAIEGADLAAGTLDIQAGSFCLSATDGGDCACSNTTLKFSESSSYTVYGWVGIAGTVTVDVADGKTLALSGNFTFKGDGNLKKTGAGTLELPFKRTDGAVTYAGATTVEGGTFILNVEPEGTFTRTVSVANGATFTKKGEGTLKLGSALSGAGTYEVTEGTLATGNYPNGNFGGTWKIGANGTLTNSGSEHYHSIGTGKVVVDGILELAPSSSASHLAGAISGAGHIHVKKSASIEGDTTGFSGTLEVDAEATLASLNTVSNYGIRCNGTITPADGKTLTIASGKTLAGTGSINSAVTFAAGSTLEVASAGALTVTRAVTMPTEGTVTVTGATTEGQPVLTCANPAGVAPRLSGAPTGLLFAANDEGTAVVLKKPVLTLAEGTTGALSAEATATLEALAAANGLAAATISGTTKNGTEKLTAEAIGDALELFTNVATVDTENGTITVAYDFGVANLSITTADPLATTLRITFKVQGAEGTSGADFAKGIVFAVTDATPGGAADTDTVLASTANGTLKAVEGSHGVAGERTFTCDLAPRTLQLFRVRVQTR